jgi:hypothetical protein
MCGGVAAMNANELREMCGCGRTCCSTEAAAGVRMHEWLRGGEADASVPRNACDCGGATSGSAVARRMQASCGGE